MGYALHITRNDDWWSESDDPQAMKDDWLAAVEGDPSLHLRDGLTAMTPAGEAIWMPGDGLAVWTGHPEIPEVPFDFRTNRISVNSPDEAILAKMLHLAEVLDARVQGDEGEFYPPRTVQA